MEGADSNCGRQAMSTVIQATPLQKSQEPQLPTTEPCLLTIFGASGDLTRRKLMPALFDLACVGCMNPYFQVVGTGRTHMDDETFRKDMKDWVKKSRDARDFNDSRWDWFSERLHYIPGDINDKGVYEAIKVKLDSFRQADSAHNRLFYVSTPASLAEPIVTGLGASGLNKHDKGWAHVIL